MNSLFEKANFVGSYYEKEMAFYSKYFQSENEELQFFKDVFSNDESDNAPRRMINCVERWANLADDLEKIRPKCDALKILCFRNCLEGLYYLSGDENRNAFFADNLLDEDKERLKGSIDTVAAYRDENEVSIPYTDRHPLDVYTKLVRHLVVHEGAFSNSEFFSDDEYGLISSVRDASKNKDLIYEASLSYEDYRDSFVRAAINMVRKYLDTHF